MPKKEKEKKGLMRTTVRLNPSVHTAARTLAIQSGISFEELVERALQRELLAEAPTLNAAALDLYESIRSVLDGFRQQHKSIDTVSPALADAEWSPLMAYRFMQSAPSPIVLKDQALCIRWCNVAYEELIGNHLATVRGKTATELGVIDTDVEASMRKVLSSNKATKTTEKVKTKDRGQRIMRVHRFPVKDLETGAIYLGDLSFDMSGDISSPRKSIPPPERHVFHLFQPFLEQCPTAVAIKDRQRRVVWCDDIYRKLAGKESIEEVKGKTAEELFQLERGHSITKNDQAVIDQELTMYVVETMPNHDPRTTLRFPIFDNNKTVQFLGALSAEFKVAGEKT